MNPRELGGDVDAISGKYDSQIRTNKAGKDTDICP